ncbi:MAG: acetate/propionate family kinase [Elusimicrobiota bacterium]
MMKSGGIRVLVFNCGSSSLTFRVFEATSESDVRTVVSGKAHRVAVRGSEPSFLEFHVGDQAERIETPLESHQAAAGLVLEKLGSLGLRVDRIGHRWGHGGSLFRTAWVDKGLLSRLRTLVPMLPIHHPAMLRVILHCRRAWPRVPQFVTADGAFHATLPPRAYTYPLPKGILRRFGFRKYGFHGLSYQYVVRAAAAYLRIPLASSRMVACHLGTGGSSAAAVLNGESVDTSMGYTALPGLVMSTRSGDIDPMLATYLMGIYGENADGLIDLLNKKSGLLGLSRFSSDIRDIIPRLRDDPAAGLAFRMYVQRLKKYIGAYAAALGGIDALVFTDDIGLRNRLLRERVCRGMAWCGIELDAEANRRAAEDGISLLSPPGARVKVLAVPTEEELVICWEGLRLTGGGYAPADRS